MSAPEGARTRTLLFGIGAIGAGIGRLAAERDDIELVGGVDSAPDKVGRPLYETLGVEARGGEPSPTIAADAAQALAATKPSLVLHATGSYLPDVLPQLVACESSGGF